MYAAVAVRTEATSAQSREQKKRKGRTVVRRIAPDVRRSFLIHPHVVDPKRPRKLKVRPVRRLESVRDGEVEIDRHRLDGDETLVDLRSVDALIGSESGGEDLPGPCVVDEPGDGTVGAGGVFEACERGNVRIEEEEWRRKEGDAPKVE